MKTTGIDKIEIIDWVDSSARGRWDSRESYDEFAKTSMECHTVGFVFYESSDRVAVVQSQSPDGVQNGIVIPKVAITKRRKLK